MRIGIVSVVDAAMPWQIARLGVLKEPGTLLQGGRAPVSYAMLSYGELSYKVVHYHDGKKGEILSTYLGAGS